MSRKYQPSNGSEGSYFTNKYCMRCAHCDPNPDGKTQCEILCATMAFDVKDEEYPSEWTYNDDGEPICTKHHQWDWELDGDPWDYENNPNALPEPVPENQLNLFENGRTEM